MQPVYRIELVRTRLADPVTEITRPVDAAQQCQRLTRFDREHLVRLDLDVRGQLISEETVAIGTVDTVLISPRELLRGALMAGATRFIVAHNHPSGDPSPSDEDMAFAKRLDKAATLMDVQLDDFIIVGDNGHFWSWRISRCGQVPEST